MLKRTHPKMTPFDVIWSSLHFKSSLVGNVYLLFDIFISLFSPKVIFNALEKFLVSHA